MVITAKEKTGAGPKHKPQKKEEHNWSSFLLLKAYKLVLVAITVLWKRFAPFLSSKGSFDDFIY